MIFLAGPEQLLGTSVLDFKLVEVVGGGGMSVVYRAQHHVTGQQVAVKVLPPELALHKETKLRFIEEARVLARFDHPSIVTLNNFTEAEGGRLCLVMQFIEGKTLDGMIRETGRLAPREAVRIGIEVCKALGYAHGNQVVHRDMKPSNVLVRPDGAVKVTDFGIARIVGSTRVTSSGQTMGTVRYMSPEQVRGLNVDARSDIYSLGVTLYEALAGDTPFTGSTAFEIMRKHLHESPEPLRKRGLDLSRSLDAVVACALRKRAEARFADAESFRQALESVPEAGARHGRPILPRAKRRWAWAMAMAVAGTASLGGAAWLANRSSRMAPSESWPELHPVAARLAPTLDQRYPDAHLRVVAALPVDAARLRDEVLAARGLFPSFLKAERITAPHGRFIDRPLNLVVLPQPLMNRADLWPDVRAGTDYPTRYFPAQSTLYVAGSPGFERRDLAYGLALHLCAPIRQLSDAECLNLAERFERFLERRR